MGIYLPRNGSAQYAVGSAIHVFDGTEEALQKEEIIAQIAIPAATMLRFPGHIMLYLGSVDGKSYVLQAIWGVRIPAVDGQDKDQVIAANRTLVSDLSLGQYSKKGSLLHRITSLSRIMYDK